MVPSASGYSTFQHEPLDHTRRSIRLLRILPELAETGLIQCDLWHATLDTKYRCLSYMWASENDQHVILINGRSFPVLKNLWDFMGVARTRYTTLPNAFWIDAVCIDQENTTEKNHQVAQMGYIYSKAEEVVAWLGVSQGIERAFAFWQEMNARKPGTFEEALVLWESHKNCTNEWLADDWSELSRSPYWKRAWITQELLLARKLQLLVNTTELEPKQIPAVISYNPDRIERQGTSVYRETRVFYTYLKALSGSLAIKGRTLISLFHLLPARESKRPRDRIYSLLPLASDAASIPVDYNSSDEELLFHLLRVFKKSMCLCLISYLTNALELQIGHGLTDASGRNMLLFAIPMGITCLRPFMGVELGQRSQYGTCSICSMMVLMGQHGEDVLCIRNFSGCMHGTHLYLSRHTTRNGESYTIKADRGQEGLPVSHVETIEDTGFCNYRNLPLPRYGYTVYLTAGVLITLLRQQAQVFTTTDVLELCSNARDGTGPLAAFETTETKRRPKPTACCSNEQCWNRNPPKYMEIPLRDPEEPWVPWAIRNPQSYYVTSCPVLVSVPRKAFDDNSDTYASFTSCTSVRYWSQPSSAKDDDMIGENVAMSVPIWDY
jgi:hypothetical protein